MKEIQTEQHITVLLEEAIEALQINQGDIVIDATLGNGGHTLKMLKTVGDRGKVIAFDLDKKAIAVFQDRIKRNFPELNKRLILVNDNFRNIQKILGKLYKKGEIKSNEVQGILADLGWRIEQIRDKKYGMSFQVEAPLNMRFDLKKGKLTAYEIINKWSKEELINIFKELGEESKAHKIAEKIIVVRKKNQIKTTKELAGIIEDVKGNRRKKIHPATKVFQALRIVVNEELNNLNEFLEGAVDVLGKEGRLAVISFHSLEDRLVKNFFRAKARGCVCPKEMPICICNEEKVVKSEKLIKPQRKEIKNNKRARSARLRVVKKIIKNKNKK